MKIKNINNNNKKNAWREKKTSWKYIHKLIILCSQFSITFFHYNSFASVVADKEHSKKEGGKSPYFTFRMTKKEENNKRSVEN